MANQPDVDMNCDKDAHCQLAKQPTEVYVGGPDRKS